MSYDSNIQKSKRVSQRMVDKSFQLGNISASRIQQHAPKPSNITILKKMNQNSMFKSSVQSKSQPFNASISSIYHQNNSISSQVPSLFKSNIYKNSNIQNHQTLNNLLKKRNQLSKKRRKQQKKNTKNQQPRNSRPVQQPPSPQASRQQQSSSQIKFGQFSAFAVKTQRQVLTRKNIIQKVIKQACLSFKAKLNQISGLNGRIQQHKQLYSTLDFKSDQQARVFMESSIEYYKTYCPYYTLLQTIDDYIHKYKLVSQNLIVDGKLIQISNLNIQKTLKHDSAIYIPIKQKQYTYAKVHVGQAGLVKVNLAQMFNSNFFTKHDLQQMSTNVLQQIKTMVILFLQYKGIVLQQSQNIIQKLKDAIK